MKLKTLGTGTAAAAALAMSALVMAPPASAANPARPTVGVDCGPWGTGQATLGAQSSGTSAALFFTTAVVWTSHSFPANSMQSTITLTDAQGHDVTFTGKANSAWTLPWEPFVSGPMLGSVTPGETLEFKSLTSSFGTFSFTCTATSPQDPGPFTF
ncbi:hypothetical protein [Streptomyces sp. NRRL F-5123]|uniref:hypothetical protein n=1 Tax=Streptomyces sp. NRRL F-5123 TaxID=1463856 RepID=UPI0004E11C5B|nr:hypothetical protein [Streptomyces sp. NRRL F-5123]